MFSHECIFDALCKLAIELPILATLAAPRLKCRVVAGRLPKSVQADKWRAPISDEVEFRQVWQHVASIVRPVLGMDYHRLLIEECEPGIDDAYRGRVSGERF